MRRLPITHRSIVSIALLGFAAGCGSDATSPTRENAFTVAEATTVASAILEEVSRALANAGTLDVGSAASRSVVPTTTKQSVNSPCTGGGTISGDVSVTVDFADDGTGSESGTMTVTPKGCRVSTGTRMIAVNGQLTYTLDFRFAKNAELTQFKWRGFGEFNWDGGNCKMDYAMDFVGNKSTISGSICGVDISSSSTH